MPQIKLISVFTTNSMLGIRLGDGSNAPSLGGGEYNIDGRVVPLPSTATHDSIAVRKPLWTRRKSLPQTRNATALNKMQR